MTDNLKAAESDAEARGAYHTRQNIRAAMVAAKDGLANLDGVPTLQDSTCEDALTEAYEGLEAAVTALGKVLEAGE